jgi:tRNA uridine 5-carbamoylmethylation protein Kti12
MNLGGNKSRLIGLTRDILLRWDETKVHWHDTRSDEFDRRVMQELFAHVNRTVLIVEKLDEVLKKVRNDCE